MRIGEWIKENPGGNWSDGWSREDGTQIKCPHCGCGTVSPVSLNEVRQSIDSHKSDHEDYGEADEWPEHEHAILATALGPKFAGSLHDHINDIDLNNNDDLYNYHRQHGLFVCGNQDCMEDGYEFFSPEASRYIQPPSERTWDESEKEDHEYNNPWDIMRGKVPTSEEHGKENW